MDRVWFDLLWGYDTLEEWVHVVVPPTEHPSGLYIPDMNKGKGLCGVELLYVDTMHNFIVMFDDQRCPKCLVLVRPKKRRAGARLTTGGNK